MADSKLKKKSAGTSGNRKRSEHPVKREFRLEPGQPEGSDTGSPSKYSCGGVIMPDQLLRTAGT